MISAWEPEVIPNEDELYMRAHFQYFDADSGELLPGVFRELPRPGCGMSTDWCAYATPQETRKGSSPDKATNFAVISLNVGEVRDIKGQCVDHDPINRPSEKNRAHTLVKGNKKRPEWIRTQFLRISVERIRLGDPIVD